MSDFTPSKLKEVKLDSFLLVPWPVCCLYNLSLLFVLLSVLYNILSVQLSNCTGVNLYRWQTEKTKLYADCTDGRLYSWTTEQTPHYTNRQMYR